MPLPQLVSVLQASTLKLDNIQGACGTVGRAVIHEVQDWCFRCWLLVATC